MNDILRSGYFKSPLGYNIVDWFVDEVRNLESKMNVYLKNSKKDIIKTEEDKEVFPKNNICRFCEKEIIPDKVRDHCHLTGK